jgi:hypothetical protein
MREVTTRWVARHVEHRYEQRIGLSFRVRRDAAVKQLYDWFLSDPRENKGRQVVMVTNKNHTHPDYPGHRVVELGLDDGTVMRFIESEVYSA